MLIYTQFGRVQVFESNDQQAVNILHELHLYSSSTGDNPSALW